MKINLLLLPALARFEGLALLQLRLLVGLFLIWGVWDNIAEPARMAEFAGFLDRFKFPFPQLLAPISVWAQFFCGIGIASGFLTRWVGLLCAFIFVAAVVMVEAHGGVRQAFPATMLVFFGLYLATRGAGNLSVDARFPRRLSSAN